jgi:eukaryotic-like serine/threonine-protein kinase
MMEQGTALAGRYRLMERVAAGGMGEVWRAFDELLGRMVAVKVVLPALHADPDFIRRFLAEARAMASVRHPGVVAIHDFGEAETTSGRRAYIVMEYIEGEPLSQALRRLGRMNPAHTMDLVSQTAQALQAVHNRGVVHRDIKPSNLMLRPDGAVALTDFGIAVARDAASLTQPGLILGSPSYVAPEQVLGQPASALSDIYSLGLVAYECLSGQRPFLGEEPLAVALQRVQYTPPPLPPDVPPQVAGVVMRALATEPAQRWRTAAEFALAADRAVKDPTPSAPVLPVTVPTPGAPVTVPTPGTPVQPVTVPTPSTPVQPVTDPTPGAPVTVPTPSTPVQPVTVARWRNRRWQLIAAVAVTAVIVGGAATLLAVEALKPAATANTPPVFVGGPAASPTTSPRGPSLPTGFQACGALLCPVGPMCWRGLVQQGDRAFPPGVEDCAAAHYWETFAALPVPDGVTSDRQLSSLMDRPDIAQACSASTMAERSRDPALTRNWRREAWPIQADAYTLLVHCLAGSPNGERPGAAFGPA